MGDTVGKLPGPMKALLHFLFFLVVTTVAGLAAGPEAFPAASEYPAIKKAAESGDLAAVIKAGICAREGIGRERDTDEAYRLFKKAADAGDALGMFYLAVCHDTGAGTEKDVDEAITWAKKAADRKHPKGQAFLGLLYSRGEGTKKSTAEGFRLVEEAARTGDGYAEVMLGYLLSKGIGADKDEGRAFQLFKSSAEKGTRLGWTRLGDAYHFGIGTRVDNDEAVACWLKATEQGHAGGYMRLANAHMTGEGVRQSHEKARSYAELAYESENDTRTYAAALLAHLYHEGLGVDKSPSQTARYLRISAAGGHIGSMNNYAALCLQPGSGVLTDHTLAVALYMVAAAKGEETAKKNIQSLQPTESALFSYSKATAIARSIMQSLDARQEIAELQEGWSSDQMTKGGSGAPRKEDRKGRVVTGSGLVFTPEGHVFTNHHVVENGKSFEVYVPSLKKKLPAKLIVSDAANDLAVLQVETWKNEPHSPALPPPIASSTKAKIGDKVFAIGFPLPDALGTEAKYTSGDVSSLSGIGDDKRVIQISAPIQPGNSGGPLALADGRIVGVVVATLNYRLTLKESGSLPQNVNFAVKSDYLRILAANSGVDIPDDLKVTGSPVEHVNAYTVQVICTQ